MPTNSPKAELDLRGSGKKREEMDWFLIVEVKKMRAYFEMNSVYWSVGISYMCLWCWIQFS